MTINRKELLKIYIIYISLFIIINVVNRISLNLIDGATALLLSIVLIFITIMLYFVIVRRNSIIVYSIFNAIVAGGAISYYYSIKSVVPYNSFILIFGFTLMMLINYYFIIRTKRQYVFIRINIIISIMVIIAGIYIVVGNYLSLGSSLMFLSIFYLCFNISLLRYINKSENYIKILSFATILMFGGLIIAITGEDDLLEIGEGLWDNPYSKKK